MTEQEPSERTITSKERNARHRALRDLSFNDGSPRISPSELFPYGLFSRKPRDPQYDRETAIIAATGVEQGLEVAIASVLDVREDASILLFGGEPPLIRDFDSKIKTAYVLGIVGALTKSDLQHIRRVRNAFAHTRSLIYFDTPEVMAVCDLITIPNREPMTMAGNDFNDARERFIQSCFRLHLHLFNYDKEKHVHMPSLLD